MQRQDQNSKQIPYLVNDLSYTNSQQYQQQLMNHQFNQLPPPMMYDQNTSRSIYDQNPQNIPTPLTYNNELNYNNHVKQNQQPPQQNQNQKQILKQNNQNITNQYDLESTYHVMQNQQTSAQHLDYSSNQSNKKTIQRYQPSAKPNTFSHKISTTSNKHIFWYSDTTGYHSVKCCYIFYKDDCFLKWMLDFLFYFFFFPFKIMGLLIISITRLCCKGNNCCLQVVQLVEEIAYSPVSCLGSWINQCWYSTKKYCCKDINYLEGGIMFFLDDCCMQCCVQTGQCIKSCCSFSINCKSCKCCDCSSLCANKDGECCCQIMCMKIGDCFQNLCTPQGLCEDFFGCINRISCDCINTKCLESICCCCFKIKSLIIQGETLGSISKCCCCVINTFGNILK